MSATLTTAPQQRVASRSDAKRVTHIAFSMQTGGMEKLLVEFARHTDRAQFNPDFVSLTTEGTPAEDIRATGARVSVFGKQDGFRWSAVRRLAAHFKANNTQIVHTHNSGAMIYGALAGRIAGVPVVVHTRHGQRRGASARQTRVFKSVSRLCDRIVGVSEDSSRMSLSEGLNADRLDTIWNGIDTAKFDFTGPKPDGPALVVARLAPEKDFSMLIVAVALVARQRPDFRLRIAGNGPRRKELNETIQESGLTKHIELLGERNDIPQLLSESSMFILPSKSEGISLTLLEAMSAGLPCIATRVGGNAEIIQHSHSGYLTPKSDPVALASTILHLIHCPDEASTLGRSGRMRVEAAFDIRRMVRDYESLYSTLHEEKQGQQLGSTGLLSLIRTISPSLRRNRKPAIAGC